MLTPDLNVLLYAVNADDPHHRTARAWLDASLNGRDTVGFTWLVLVGFVRIATRAGIFPTPIAVRDAIGAVRTWLDAPFATVLEPTRAHLGILDDLLAASGTGGNLTNDAHLAALAIEHDATVGTFDRDFARWPGVRVVVPPDAT